MTISLYQASVATYQQMLAGLNTVLEKGAQHFQKEGGSAEAMLNECLYPNMLPFSFQIRSAVAHSIGCIEGMQAGTVQPPQDEPELDYAGLQALVADTIAKLEKLSADEVDSLSGKTVIFKAGEVELPFTAENFVLSFSLPNFYFHVTTAYGLLRKQGVEIGKVDYLGPMRLAL